MKKPFRAPLWLIALSIMIPTATAMLATSATNVALPHIAGTFGSTHEEVNWVITSYMIANAMMLPMTGFLESVLGRRGFLKIFFSIFMIGSIVCIFAPSLNILILGRIIQGMGSGPFMPMAQSVLIQSFPEKKRGTAMAVFAFAVMTAAILGPTVGGLLVDNMDWSWIFIINIPIGIVSIVLIDMFIPQTPKHGMPEKFDFFGLGLLITWLLSMQIVLDKGQQYGWFDCTWICWLSGLALFSMVFFIVWELEYKHAFVNFRVFKNLNFAIGTLLGSFVNVIIYVTIVLVPMFLQNSMGYTATLSGLSLAPRAISSIVMLFIVGKLVEIVDSRILIAIGFVFLGISTFMYANISLVIPFKYIVLPNVLLGIGVIFTFIPISAMSLGTLSKDMMSMGAGLHSLSKCVATSFSISISSALVMRYSQIHQGYLVDNLTVYNLNFQERMAALVAKYAHFYPHFIAAKKANIAMYHQLLAQSKLFAFVTVFEAFALIAFLLLPLIFVLKLNKSSISVPHRFEQ